MESEDGKGSVFHSAIPLKEALPPKPLVPNPILKGKTLIVAAPHAGVRSMIESLVESWGMSTLCVGTAVEVVQKIASGPEFSCRRDRGGSSRSIGQGPRPGDSPPTRSNHGAVHPALFAATAGRLRPKSAARVRRLPGQAGPLPAVARHPGHVAQGWKSHQQTSAFHRPDRYRFRPAPSDAPPPRRGQHHQSKSRDPRILSQMGYRPDVVHNGVEVLEALARQKYDVILMDIQMPRHGRARGDAPDPPKIHRRESPLDHRHDRQCDGFRPQKLFRRRHGRLPEQARAHRGAGSRTDPLLGEYRAGRRFLRAVPLW